MDMENLLGIAFAIMAVVGLGNVTLGWRFLREPVGNRAKHVGITLWFASMSAIYLATPTAWMIFAVSAVYVLGVGSFLYGLWQSRRTSGHQL